MHRTSASSCDTPGINVKHHCCSSEAEGLGGQSILLHRSQPCDSSTVWTETDTSVTILLLGGMLRLTLSMLRLPSYKAQGRKDFWKLSKPCHVGIHWIGLNEYSQMSTHLTGFQSFFMFCVFLYRPS